MVNVFDVAQYILSKMGSLTTWKLQKLCYYSQAWSLVWDDKPLFKERIEAWANGPVIPALYKMHQGEYSITSIKEGDPSKLNRDQGETVDAIIDVYGAKDSNWLSELTHNEAPWINARQRGGLSPGERGNSEITLTDMSEYYGGLYGKTPTEKT
jgi:uncharacterized phage-associated protein